MTAGKNKMINAMTVGLDSDFPVIIPYTSILLRDHWDEITDKPWWAAWSGDIDILLEIKEDFLKKVDIDYLFCEVGPSRETRKTHKIEVCDGQVFLVNTLTGSKERIYRQPIGGTQESIDKEPQIKSIKDVDKHFKVADEKSLFRDGHLDYARAVIERFGPENFIAAHIGSPFDELADYFGFRGALISLFRRPELVEYFLKKAEERWVEYSKAYARVGVDGVWVQAWLSSADIISLSMFEKFALPYIEDLLSEIRRLGIKSILYHCGDLHDRLDRLVEAGPDCIGLEESRKGFNNDIAWVNKVVAGRSCILGNIDAIWVLEEGTRKELEQEINRQLYVGREYGRFIMSLGSPVTPSTPIARVKEYVDITRQSSTRR